MIFWIFISLLITSTAVEAIRLACGNGTQSMEVVENATDFTLTCDGYDKGATVEWQRKKNVSQSTNLGRCNASSCTLSPGVPNTKISVTHVSSSSSRLTISYTTRNDDDVTYMCSNETCKINIMYPANVSSCSLIVIKETWTVNVACKISKAYSPSNNYSCHWFRNTSQTAKVLIGRTTYIPTNHSDARYRNGSCNYTSELQSGDGSYDYTVVVFPGGTEEYIDRIVIEQPRDPNILCQEEMWTFENESLKCNSTTSNIGKPPGRLDCFMGDKLLSNASLGDTSVAFTSHPLKRQDNGVNITCRINWINNSTGVNYTTTITYPPSKPNITGKPIMEGIRANLTCLLSNPGNPPALVSWSWEDDDTPLGNESVLTLHNVTRGDNNNTIICRADNVFTKKRNSNIVGKFVLAVYYPPSQPTITGRPLIEGTRANLTCLLSDFGNPPASLIWSWDDNGTELGNNESKLSISSISRGENNRTINCRAENIFTKIQNITLVDNFTLIVYYPPNMTNITGEPVMDESRANFSCLLSDSGNPPALLSWHWEDGGTLLGNGSVLMLPSVHKSDNNRTIICRAKNVFTKEKKIHVETKFKLVVYYRPTIPTITGGTFMEETGATLTCNLSNPGNPVASLSWSWEDDGTPLRNNKSVLKLHNVSRRDNNRTVICRAENVYTESKNITVQATFRLTVYYPPSVTNITGKVVMDETTANFSCLLSDTGNPPALLSWHWENDSTPLGNESVLMLPTVNKSDNNRTIVCRAENVYTKEKKMPVETKFKLVVYYGPSTPTITGGPFMEGTNATLMCNVSNPGNPVASFSWSWEDDGTALGKNTSLLTLLNVHKRENNRTIICRVDSVFTKTKNINVEAKFKLTVYYKAILTINDKNVKNTCKPSHSNNICTVTEGERIHFKCSTDSNPAPTSVVWVKVDSNETVSEGYILDLIAKHNVHTANFSCTASVDVFINNITSHLTSSFLLTVIVNYAPRDTVLILNNGTVNLTVQEGQNVVLTCQSHGRPPPSITIHDKSHDRIIKTASGHSASSLTQVLVHNIDSARCQNSTTYRCGANNILGLSKESFATLFVKCAPKREDNASTPTPLNYDGQAVSFTFTVIAYPPLENTPQTCYNNKMVNVTSNKCSITCTVTNVIYKSTCKVTIDGVTTDDAGLYRIRPKNEFGSAADDVTFNLTVKVFRGRQEDNLVTVIGVGASLGVAVIIAVATFIVVMQRRKERSQSKNRKMLVEKESRDSMGMMNNTLYATADNISGPAHGNKPLPKKSSHDTQYENAAFNTTEVEYANQSTVDQHGFINQDGLVYTTIEFSSRQARKAKEPPPQREATEYACVDFSRTTAFSQK